MYLFLSFCNLLFCFNLVCGQIADPPIPPKIVSKHAQDVLSSGRAANCEKACAQLASNFSAQVVFAPSEIDNIWSAQQGELTPACRIQPTSATEVAITLEILKTQQCHFAIKSGGHSRMAGASNAEGGVTIDLAQLNSVKLSKDKKSVHVGAGSRWFDVYRTLETESLVVVGGRVADVGVGGLLLGGGLSFFSNRYGWGCDNVLSYEIVLPSGEITTVDEKHHRELYRALRGAGSTNFGIVTSFELETFKLANPAGLWWNHRFADFKDAPQVLDGQHELYTKGLASDPDAAFIHVFGYSSAHDSFFAITTHVHTSHQDLSTTPDSFAMFDKIKPIQKPDLAIVPMSNASYKFFEMNPPPGKRNLYGTFCNYHSREFEGKFVEMAEQTMSTLKNVTGFFGAHVMQPVFGSARELMWKRGGNALGLASKEGHLNIMLQSWQWADPADDELINSKIRDLTAAGEELAKEMKVYHPYKYVNYAEEWQDVFSGLGEKNLKSLRKLQRKYDPDGIFTKGGLGDGYFKLNEKVSGMENSSKDEL